MNELNNDRYYSRWTQHVAFNFGNLALWAVNAAFSTWVFSFYFSALKLDAIYIGLAFVIWSLWNAVNDPLIGYLSDRTQTKIGRRKPYIIFGLLGVIVVEIVLWIPPVRTDIGLFWYLLGMLIAWDIFYTCLALPYDTLFPEMYLTEKQRASSNTFKQLASIIGLLAAYLLSGSIIVDIEVEKGYLINGIVISLIVAITVIISLIWGIKERSEFSLDHKHEFSFLQGLKYAFKNKGFIIYTIIYFFYEFFILTIGTVIPLFGKHILDVDAFSASILTAILFIVGFITVPLWWLLHRKIGSKISFIISIIFYVGTSIPLFFITDYMQAAYTAGAMGLGFGGCLYYIYLIVADVIDEDELKTGVRREGTFFGITNFFMRLSMILSILCITLVFEGTGWGEWTPDPGKTTEFGIRFLVAGFPAISLMICLICLFVFPYSKKRVKEIKFQLDEMHQQKKEKVQHRHTENH
ncbi:MAG: MFS transporter [Candidatus Lokiarchaeota archaeon]|nr:MFS transporter [Candidatus Lokiarchaeota archaeon]